MIKTKEVLPLSLAAFTATLLSIPGLAQQGQAVAGYKLLTTIATPGNLAGGNDISWVDPSGARYYLADRGVATATPPIAAHIDVIDTQNVQFLASIPLTAAPNGVVAVPRAHELWAGLSDSTVAVINTDNYTVTHVVNTGGKMRADELAYDPVDRVILIANDRDSPPFVSFISAQNYTVLKTLNYDGAAAPQSTGGLEQPVWDGVTGKFYMSIPATSKNPNGEVDELDPIALTVTRSMPTVCKGPAGLVLVPNQRLVTSCGDVIDIVSGAVVTTIQGVSGDEIYYSAGDQRVYFAGGTDRISVNVVDANTYAVLTSLTVGQIVPSPGVSQTTHSVAVDADSNLVFVPVTGAGVEVWRNGASLTATPNPITVTSGTVYTSALISWNAPNAKLIEVHVGSPTGPLFTQNGSRGAMATGVWVADGTAFYLQDVTGGVPASAANTIATAVVRFQSKM